MRVVDIGVCIVLLALAGCASKGPQVLSESNVAQLYQRQWELQSVLLDGRHDIMHVDARMTLIFAPDGQVAGFTSVNRFAGAIKLTPDGKLTWLSLAIVGPRQTGAPELMDKERNFLEALRKTNMAIIGRHALVLQRDDGTTVLAFDEAGY